MSRLGYLAFLIAVLTVGGCGGSDQDAVDPDPFYGTVSVDVPNAPDYARMASGGMGTYRVTLAWSTVEAVKGTYDWSSYDVIMNGLAANGIEPQVVVLGTPAGYADAVTDPPTQDAETFDAWADFLEAAVERYGPSGDFWETLAQSEPDVEARPARSWEIWNEPNTSLFWTPAPDPDDYAALLKRSARVIGEVDPDAEIMTGGMFATPGSEGAIVSYDFLAEVYDQRGVDEIVDIVGVHPYSPDVAGLLRQLDGTREVIEEAGDDAGTWITEMGWSSDPNGPADQAKTPEQQASLLRKSFTRLSEERETWDLRGLVWFQWHDTEGPVGECVWCQYSGLVDADRDAKPAWVAFTEITGGTP